LAIPGGADYSLASVYLRALVAVYAYERSPFYFLWVVSWLAGGVWRADEEALCPARSRGLHPRGVVRDTREADAVGGVGTL